MESRYHRYYKLAVSFKSAFFKHMKFNTLRQRLVFLLTMGTMVSFIFIASISYNALKSMQVNRIDTSIESTLERFTEQLDRDYYNLMHITQQMMPEGSVGRDVDEYLFTDNPYDKSLISRKISSSIELICSYPNVTLAMYYHPQNDSAFFSNLPSSEDLNIQSLPTLVQDLELIYQTFHPSFYKFSDQQVISVIRKVVFSNNLELEIYVEAQNDIGENFDVYFNSQNMPYVFMQLDASKKIRYTSNPDVFPVGEMLESGSGANTGSLKDYVLKQRESRFGFINVLLVPVKSYNQELYQWRAKVLSTTLIILLIITLAAVMLHKLIYKPLDIFKSEMNRLGEGNMDAVSYHTGIEEFDRMFERFNVMKRQIQKLMHDIEVKENQRHKLEVEMLYYQINPHFLMNALNSVHWMAVMKKQYEISTYISELNYVLRYSLGKSDRNTILRTEIKMLKTYINLQKNRYTFDAVINIEEGDYLDTPVPRLILQPLAENAICHGLDENGKLSVDISADYKEEKIKVIIQDDGKGMDEELLESIRCFESLEDPNLNRGIGLKYVHLMLRSFYGDRFFMSIESKPMKGTTVKLFLPFSKEVKQ